MATVIEMRGVAKIQKWQEKAKITSNTYHTTITNHHTTKQANQQAAGLNPQAAIPQQTWFPNHPTKS
jgi:hypothetical protein